VTDHTPPNDLDAERIALGAMLLSAGAVDEVSGILSPADYYRATHGTVHAAIVAQAERGEPTDAVAVAARLLETGELQRVGGIGALHDLIEAVPTAANGAWHARRVRELAQRRNLIAAGAAIARHAADPAVDLATAVDRGGRAFYDATTAHASGDLKPTAALLPPALDAVRAAGSPGAVRGVPTGFTEMDGLLGGLKPGQLIVVAGRPGMGKSVLAGDFTRAAAIGSARTTAYFSLEMSNGELVNRFLAAEAKVPLRLINAGQLDAGHWLRLAPAAERLSAARIHIDDSAALTLTEIRSRARRLGQRGGLALVVVDYLQLMTPSGRRGDNREQEVAEISRGLKGLAKDLDVPVVAVAQLNRGPEQRGDKRPQLSDLRESGSIEADADVVILLHREGYYDRNAARVGEADLIVAKHRGGPTATVTVAEQLHLARFVDMAVV